MGRKAYIDTACGVQRVASSKKDTGEQKIVRYVDS